MSYPGYDPAKKGGAGAAPPPQYAYAVSLQPGQVGGGAQPSSYNIELGGQKAGGSGHPQYQQYPEAQVNTIDPNGPPVEGEPLYGPEEVAGNPNLRRFVKSGFKDVWASFLFTAFFLVTVVWGIVNMVMYKPIGASAGNHTAHSNTTAAPTEHNDLQLGLAVVVVSISLGVSLFTAIFCLVLTRLFPRQLIYIANILVICMSLASGILFALSGAIVGLIVMLVVAGLQALWLFLVRRRIPFSAALLKTASTVLGRHKAVFFSNILISLVFFGFSISWGFAMLRPVDRLDAKRGNGSDGFLIGLFTFTFLWTAQVMVNLMHVTTAGVVATWYFAGAANMPKYPTMASFKRAITTSFGSICFGSLVVAVVQFIRFLLESSRGEDEGNSFLRCVVDCLLGCLERLVEYFNTYAFVHVAVYGCGYIEAAKRTFALCKQCFFAAYFNDCLVQPTMDMLALAAAVVIGGVFGLGTRSWAIFVVVLALSWIVHKLMFSALSSAITTLFVCFAELPEGLQASDPELYAAIHAADNGAVHGGSAPAPNV